MDSSGNGAKSRSRVSSARRRGASIVNHASDDVRPVSFGKFGHDRVRRVTSRQSRRCAWTADWCRRRSPGSGIAVDHSAQLRPGTLFQRIGRIRIPRSEVGQLVSRGLGRKCAAKSILDHGTKRASRFPGVTPGPGPAVRRGCRASCYPVWARHHTNAHGFSSVLTQIIRSQPYYKMH